MQRLALGSRTDVSHACDASLELARHLEARFRAEQYASTYQQCDNVHLAHYTKRQPTPARCRAEAEWCYSAAQHKCAACLHCTDDREHCMHLLSAVLLFAVAACFRTDGSDEPTRAVLESLRKVNSAVLCPIVCPCASPKPTMGAWRTAENRFFR